MNELEMDGLVVDYDGKRNVVMYHGLKEYPIGGMAAEYANLHPTEIKDVLLAYENKDKNPKEGNYMAEFFPWFVDQLEDKFGTVTAIMVTFDFLSFAANFVKASEEEWNEIVLTERSSGMDEIKKFIFQDTSYTDFGSETIEQLLLTCYYWYADSFVAFRHSFDILVATEEHSEEQIDAFGRFFGDNIGFQHIDYKIACYDGKFTSLYTIKSSMSLILFEAAHAMDSGTVFVKCANCGKFFVPEGRSDAIYCSNPSPQNPRKICKEIGAQVTRANKEKNDIVTKEYRKVYMKYKMITTRHPEDREGKKTFVRLTEEVKEWRRKLADGIVTVDDFLEWLGMF